MTLRDQIQAQAMALFRANGLHFTMQQLAQALHVSKKTLYTVYPGKEALLMDLVDTAFAAIHRRKRQLIDGPGTVPQRVRAVIVALPDDYAALDLRQLAALDEKYPAVAARVRRHLETGWEPTLALLAQGVAEGSLRPVNLAVLRQMVTGAIEQLLARPDAAPALAYPAALAAMIDILMNGIEAPPAGGQPAAAPARPAAGGETPPAGEAPAAAPARADAAGRETPPAGKTPVPAPGADQSGAAPAAPERSKPC